MTGLKPLLGIALSLTLVLTGFACAYIAMAIPKNNTSRGAVVLIGAALAFFEPWIGLLIGIATTIAAGRAGTVTRTRFRTRTERSSARQHMRYTSRA